MRFLLIAVLVCLVAACNRSNLEGNHSAEVKYIENPAGNHSEVPRLFTSANGDVYMSWIEKQGELSLLKYAKLVADQWSSANLISQGDNWFVNWADFPSLIVGENYFAAHWLQKRDKGTYDYDVRISTSVDGINWSNSFIPHKDGLSAEHGFVSMLPMKNKQFFATWLDGRNTKSSGHVHGEMKHAGAMTLRAGIFDLDGSTIEEWELDNRTCDCCQTSASIINNQPTVVYRDRSESEVRDIYMTSLNDKSWTKPLPVSMDLWKIAGCPVNGPALTFNGEKTAVAWYTAAGNTPKVQLALSGPASETFEQTSVIAEGETLGRVGITVLEDNSFVVSWLRNTEKSATIMLSKYDSEGNFVKEVPLTETSPERASGFPVITNRKNQVIAAWTVDDDSSFVKTAIIDFN